jgi:tRNA pseudouridine13 synthase
MTFPDIAPHDVAALPRLLAGDVGGAGDVVMRPGIGDFVVEEVPLYRPSGSGDHWYLWIEKQGISTPAVVKALCQQLRLREVDIGFAGNKDAHGTTRQWMSVPVHNVDPTTIAIDGATVKDVGRHNNKLRRGHLWGNRFHVRLSGNIDAGDLQRRATSLAGTGFPSYFGQQRFGHHNEVVEQAVRFLAQGRPSRSRREEFWVSAVQSVVFNTWLSLRQTAGLWDRPVDGDLMLKHGKEAPFVCTDPATDRERAIAGEISPAGPLPGRRMRSSEREALTWESRSFAAAGLPPELLLAHPAFDAGDRRSARTWPQDISVDAKDDVHLSFSLRSGVYATVFLKECVGTRLIDGAAIPIDG